jgi:hypothetical protein
MKQIPLTQGKIALVDDADFEWLSQFKWYAQKTTYGGYTAARGCSCWLNKKLHMILMHRQITSCPFQSIIDHKNHNPLDNRRINLRICSRTENNRNSNISLRNTSGFKGVIWDKVLKKWRTRICFNKKQKHIGLYTTKVEAAKSYNDAAIKYFGEYANLNNITNTKEMSYAN